MPEFIAFSSAAHNQGKRTLSQAFANLLATNENKVLYVELDYIHPSFAVSTQISHPKRNLQEYILNCLKANRFNPKDYILTKSDIKNRSERQLQSHFNSLPETMDYLTLPLNSSLNSFPTIIEQGEEEKGDQFVSEMMYELSKTHYDYIIINTPNDWTSIFGLPIFGKVDRIINVLTAAPYRVIENREFMSALGQLENLGHDDITHLLNLRSPSVSDGEYSKILDSWENTHPITYDQERISSELALKFGSEQINLELESVALKLGLSVVHTPRKRKSFLGIGGS